MTSLTYIVRKDWGQHGTAMESRSKAIRDWIGGAPYIFAVVETERLNEDRPADLEVIEHIAPEASTRMVLDIAEIPRMSREDKSIEHAIVVHPQNEREFEYVRDAVDSETIERLFVMVWSPRDRIRTWLDGRGALDFQTGETRTEPDASMVAAAEMLVSQEYNGLSSGRGKDAVVQLVRAFVAQGYAADVDAWLRAYFAAGGSFRHSESVAQLVSEMASGTKHRVKPRYREDIFTIIRDKSMRQ